MGFNFGSIFGNSGGGIAHGGTAAAVTALPTAHPTQQLEGGNGSTTATPNPVGDQTKKQPDPNSMDYQLAEMQKVWQTPTTADGKPLTPQADPLSQQLFNFDPKQVNEAAAKLDFTSGINPELAGKALGGDATALLDLINQSVQKAFVASTLNTGNLLNDGFTRHGKNIDAALPTRLRNHAVATSASEDPVLSHPAVAPMVNSMKLMIAAKDPSLTPQQVQEQAEGWAKGFAKAMSSQESNTPAPGAPAAEKETDWLKFVGLDPKA